MRRILAFSPGPSRSPHHGQAMETGVPGNKLRTVSCRVPGSSPWPPTGQAQALLVTLTHPCLCDLMAVAVFLGCHHAIRGTCPRHLGCLGGQLGPGHLDPSQKQLSRVWEPGPEGAGSWNLPPLRQDLDVRGGKLCLGALPFFVRTGNNILWVEVYWNLLTMTWPQEQSAWHREVCNN